MPLTVSSRVNTLIGRKRQWRFHVKHAGIVGFESLMKEMARSSGSASLPDIARVLLMYRETVSRLVSDGYFVQGPLGDHYLSAVGTARSEDDRFTPKLESSGHGYRLRFRPDRAVEAGIVGRVSFRRDKDSGRWNPYPRELEQIAGGVSAYLGHKKPLTFSRGEYVKLYGTLLSFDYKSGELGVFLVRRYGNDAYRCGPYVSVKPSLVIFALADDVPAGEYSLVVRTATKAGAVRSGTLRYVVRIG